MNDERERALGRVFVLLLVPLLVRLLCLLELRADPFFTLLVVDARTYYDTAAAMASGGWHMDGPFWQPPFYPFLLSWIFRVFRPSPMAVRLFQVCLGSLGCWLVFRLGDRLAGRRAAWSAWAMAAFCGPLVFFDLQLLGASLVTFLLLVALDRTVAWGASRRARHLAAAGIATGLAAITVATSLVLLPVFAAWVWVQGRAARAAALFLICAAAPVLVVTGMNLAASGQPVLVSYNSGINFWIGNNADYDRAVAIRPGRAWQALTEEPLRAGVRTEAGTSQWFLQQAGRWIAAHPGDWVLLLLKKTRLLFRGDELGRNQELYPFRSGSGVLRVLLWSRGLAFPFGLLLPLGMAGLVMCLRARRARAAGAGLLAWAFFAYAAGVIAFFVASRYRLPVLPILIVFSGAAVAGGWDALRARRGPDLLLPAAVLAAFLLIANVGLPPMPRAFHSDAYSDQGTMYYELGRLDEAVDWYERALELDPENAEAAHNLGAIWLQRNRLETAEPLFRRVLASWPEDEKALINLGNVYFRNGEPYRAGRYFLEARRLYPGNPDAARNLTLAQEMAAKLERERMAADPEAFLGTLEKLRAKEPGNEFLKERLKALRAERAAPGR